MEVGEGEDGVGVEVGEGEDGVVVWRWEKVRMELWCGGGRR